ncbi:recombinase family protein [Brucella gallinifaecis]|uniref:recombinase family protein n=1 Tax=Brucella gallinifaecis TaxID=215590 RepID=UPI00235F6309|nr:recombinase family protein [Brucella gallinifaecis]
MFYGYIRRSLADTDTQYAEQKKLIIDCIKQADYSLQYLSTSDINKHIFEDYEKGWSPDNKLPAKLDLMKRASDGDTIFIQSPDKIASTARSFYDFINIMLEAGVTVVIEQPQIYLGPNQKPAGTQIIFSPKNREFRDPLFMLEAIAGLESAINAERIMTAKALQTSNKPGRKPAINDEQIAKLKEMVAANKSQLMISKELKISQATVSRYVNDLFRDGRKTSERYLEEPTARRKSRRDYLKAKKES